MQPNLRAETEQEGNASVAKANTILDTSFCPATWGLSISIHEGIQQLTKLCRKEQRIVLLPIAFGIGIIGKHIHTNFVSAAVYCLFTLLKKATDEGSPPCSPQIPSSMSGRVACTVQGS